MKILLLGEYSNVHNNLAEGLRALGHDVTTASAGHGWSNYNRDIDLGRSLTFFGRISYIFRLIKAMPKLCGYDIIQFINPHFLKLKAERIIPIFRFLRKHNKGIILCAMGDDYYYCYGHKHKHPLAYSDYNMGDKPRATEFGERAYNECVGTAKEKLSREMAYYADYIVSVIYEYYAPYDIATDIGKDGRPIREKNHFIPLPIKMPELVCPPPSEKLRVFLGYKLEFLDYKGADIMIKVAKDLLEKYPDKMELKLVTNTPFAEYQHMMDNSDVLMDQIYSYGPGMNALLALSKGIVCISGGEDINYEMMGEYDCRAIINVKPTYESVYSELEKLILMPKDELQALKEKSREYVRRNHECVKVARQYEALYKQILKKYEDEKNNGSQS